MADRSNDNDVVVFEFRDAESARAAATEVRDHGVDLHADGSTIEVALELHDRVSVTLLRHGGHAVHPEVDDDDQQATPASPPAGQA